LDKGRWPAPYRAKLWCGAQVQLRASAKRAGRLRVRVLCCPMKWMDFEELKKAELINKS